MVQDSAGLSGMSWEWYFTEQYVQLMLCGGKVFACMFGCIQHVGMQCCTGVQACVHAACDAWYWCSVLATSALLRKQSASAAGW
jgi:hypothetical protein